MRSDVIVIASVGSQDPAQMRLTQDDDMVVCTENLNPHVIAMKSAKDRVRFDASGPLNWARDRRIFVQ